MSEQPGQAASLDPKAYANFDEIDDDFMANALRGDSPPPRRGSATAPDEPPAQNEPAAKPPRRPRRATRSTETTKRAPAPKTSSNADIEDAPAPPAPQPDVQLRPTAFNISTDLWEDFVRVRHERNWDNGQLIIDAIEKTYANKSLHAEIKRARVEVGGALFTPLVNTRPTRRGVRRIDAKLHPDHFPALKRLVAELGTHDRSALVDAALRAYLTKSRKESNDNEHH